MLPAEDRAELARRRSRVSSTRLPGVDNLELEYKHGHMGECPVPASPGLEENTMSGEKRSLYERLGGYDALAAVANDLLPRLQADPQLGRFWAHRGEDGVKREKQLLMHFLCASAGGPMYYRGRDMVPIHRGMRIS